MRRMAERDGAELVELLRRARATGVTTSLDMTMPDPNGFAGEVDWRAVLEAALPHVDLYLPSLDETLYMLGPGFAPGDGGIGPEPLDRVARELLALGPAAVGLKLGPFGLYLRTAQGDVWRSRARPAPRACEPWYDRQLWSPCFEVEVAGTTGAGDATIAGFLAALLRGSGPEECLTMGCAVGACSVEAPDAFSGVRSWEDTLARRQGGWPRRGLPLDRTAWRRDPASGVWRGPADARYDDTEAA
jgi:sugar/nucleoside kinase (ribokinase family)